ncbi:hypothetical protein SAMN04488003_106152 [Loktanella fryxellensis]|uniref:Uncharacterized protein n=1 Tax=Loktanella fryxellensis TaxID=245187 RepID=A0A1H8CBW1_9RHOB|nr:hypothetical protein SAMN04488003_106152 [Loktanella fryxellensis]
MGKGHADYLSVGWKKDRGEILRGMEESAFVQTIRGGRMTGLYNRTAIWPLFGYEGESASLGPCIERGVDEIDWL